jgi:hypothetical protein
LTNFLPQIYLKESEVRSLVTYLTASHWCFKFSRTAEEQQTILHFNLLRNGQAPAHFVGSRLQPRPLRQDR